MGAEFNLFSEDPNFGAWFVEMLNNMFGGGMASGLLGQKTPQPLIPPAQQPQVGIQGPTAGAGFDPMAIQKMSALSQQGIQGPTMGGMPTGGTPGGGGMDMNTMMRILSMLASMIR